MEARWTLHIAIDGTHGYVEHIDGCLEIDNKWRSTISTKNTVRPVRVRIGSQMVFSGEICEFVSGNFTPGGECSSVEPPTYRTMAMTELRKLTPDFIPHRGALTSTRNHDKASTMVSWSRHSTNMPECGICCFPAAPRSPGPPERQTPRELESRKKAATRLC